MKYIRTKNFVVELETWMKIDKDILIIGGATHKIVKQADTIRDLIQSGDIIFYWHAGSKKEHCMYVADDLAAYDMKSWPITRLLVPVGKDYRQVAIGNPELLNNEYLINAGELEIC